MRKPSSRRRRSPQKLSERQKKILRYIQHCYEDTGYPPTIREIGNAVDIASTSVVNYNLNKLEQAGYIEREKKVSRGLRLLRTLNNEEYHQRLGVIEDNSDTVSVPMAGKIVASEPVALPGDDFGMYVDDDDMIAVPSSLLGKHLKDGKIFALRVNGESMIDALVSHDDIVVLQRQDTANDGDMVAVWLTDNHEMTLKYFYHEGKQVRLQPANTTMDPIFVEARQVQIQGRVLAVLRQL